VRLFKDSLFCILLLVLTRTVTRESVIMCIQCARSNPNQPCRLEKSQEEQVLPARKRKHEHGHGDVEQGGGQARLPWKEAIRQAAMEEDHERDVMLQPKRSTWDSYVPSKSKTKVVMRRMRMRMMKVVVNGDNSGGTPACPPRWYLGALRTLFCKAGHGVRPSGVWRA